VVARCLLLAPRVPRCVWTSRSVRYGITSVRYKLSASVAEQIMLNCAGPALDWCAVVVVVRQSGIYVADCDVCNWWSQYQWCELRVH
jgi:hypothetical protein